jgi:hypothetical protein
MTAGTHAGVQPPREHASTIVAHVRANSRRVDRGRSASGGSARTEMRAASRPTGTLIRKIRRQPSPATSAVTSRPRTAVRSPRPCRRPLRTRPSHESVFFGNPRATDS